MKRCWMLLALIIFSSQILGVNLFDESVYRAPISDRKAYLPGDLLTVIVLETSNAKSSTELASSKNIKTALEANYKKNNYELGLGVHGQGASHAKTERNGNIKATITVQIASIFPNGSYQIVGRQRIHINGERQTIYLKGIVRPEDISPQNNLLSTRIADAEISYTGDGSVSRSQNPNMIYRVLSYLGVV